MTYHLGINLRRSIAEQGFGVIDRLISASEIADLRDRLFDLHNRNVGFHEGAQFDAAGPEDGSERRFPQIMMPSAFAPELNTHPFRQIAADMARQIIGPGARFKADISLLKPPLKGAPTPWHQDEAFSNPDLSYAEISIWLALTPATASNSCMSFIAGTHLGPVLPHQPMNNDPRIHALECMGDFDPSLAIECPLEPGGCTIHLHRTLHSAGPNLSAQPRLAYVLIFDTPHRRSSEQRDFPWLHAQNTDRSVREQQWRRRGGIIVHMWRQRHRMRLSRLFADALRARYALRKLIARSNTSHRGTSRT